MRKRCSALYDGRRCLREAGHRDWHSVWVRRKKVHWKGLKDPVRYNLSEFGRRVTGPMKPSQEVGLIAIELAQASGLGEEQAHLFYMCAVCAVLDRLHDRLDAIERPITKDPIDFAIVSD